MKKLIFFVSKGMAEPQLARRAFRFARTAHAEGLPSEVRLAGEAVLLAQRENFAAMASDSHLYEHMNAVLNTPEITVSLCPVSAQQHGLPTDQLAHPGFSFKYLAKVLREVSEGEAELIYLG